MKKILNLGSGKNYMADALNVDINDLWKPDIKLDIQSPMYWADSAVWCGSLPNNHFEKIIAHDVLEHISNLVQAMTNCLEILKVGGKMDIIVPYDLSHGAWQDPTHVRAFNERSWLYYTDWFWYLGWKTHRFIEKSLDFILNPDETETEANILIETPRAIEAMHVVLEKITLTDEDKANYEKYIFTSGAR